MFKKEDVTGLIKSLVEIESPYFQEDNVMDFAFKWLKDKGLDARLHSYSERKALNYDGKNVILELQGKRQGKHVCLNGHLDTVPLCEGWTKDPYAGSIEGDRLYGLGALDMKAGCAANMIAVEQFIRDYGDDFAGKISLSLVSDEEGPFGLGTNAILEEGLLDDVDVALVTEPTAGFSATEEFPLVCLGARGCFKYYIDFFGKSAHASTPEKGLNAAVEAAKFILESRNVELKDVPPLGKGSFVILKMEADGGACSVPDRARVYVHRHCTVGETEAMIIAEADALCRGAGVECKYEIGFDSYPTEGSKSYVPYYVEETNPYVGVLSNAVEAASGKTPALGYFASIGDFNYLGTRLGGTPTFVFGPDGDNFHGADEYVELETAYLTAVTVYEFLKNILLDR